MSKADAALIRAGWMSARPTQPAPAALAVSAHSTPIGPAPVTSTREPMPVPALRFAHRPTESGSIRAAASSLIESGTG